MLLGALLALVLLSPLASGALVEVRPLTARVHDDAGILSPAETSALIDELERFERETGHQIAVLTLKSLEGEAIEEFSMRVAESWKVGQAKVDDGILVIVAAEDKKARIEVGYGLEGVVPDAVAARIVRDQMIPRFRVGAMGDGIRAAVEALMSAARGEPMAAAPEGSEEWARGHRRGGGANVAHAVLIATILGVFLGSQVTRRRRGLAPVASGLLAAVAAWIITFALPATIFAAIAALALSIVFSSSGPGRGLRGGPSVFGPGGFGGGGFGGGFGGGGFGGGGGGFGGGGASGSW